MHGQVGQHLAVDLDAGQAQPVDEAAVGQRLVMAAHCGINPLDPQRTEVALAVLAVAGRILVGLVDGLRGDLEGVLAAAIVTFRCLDDLLVTGVGDGSTFNTALVLILSGQN